MAGREITDEEALRRLRAASDVLGSEDVETVAGQSAMHFARLMLVASMEAIETPETAQGMLKPEEPQADG